MDIIARDGCYWRNVGLIGECGAMDLSGKSGIGPVMILGNPRIGLVGHFGHMGMGLIGYFGHPVVDPSDRPTG
jgi:hypothetical protein